MFQPNGCIVDVCPTKPTKGLGRVVLAAQESDDASSRGDSTGLALSGLEVARQLAQRPPAGSASAVRMLGVPRGARRGGRTDSELASCGPVFSCRPAFKCRPVFKCPVSLDEAERPSRVINPS